MSGPSSSTKPKTKQIKMLISGQNIGRGSQNNERPGMHQRRREEQVLFLTTQSAHPLDSRFHNHGQIYCYFIFINDRVTVGAASELEQSGWMLAGL